MTPLIQDPKEVPAKLERCGGRLVVTSEEAIEVSRREQIRIEVDPKTPNVRLLIEQKKPDRYAMHCGVPMIPTCAFYKAELYCMECGAKLGLFSPGRASSGAATAAHHRAFEKVAREWDEHVGPFILPDNREALNDEEREASERARAWLIERQTV